MRSRTSTQLTATQLKSTGRRRNPDEKKQARPFRDAFTVALLSGSGIRTFSKPVEEEEERAICVEIHLEDYSLERFQRHQEAFCKHVAENLGCDRVEVAKKESARKAGIDRVIVETHIVGFIDGVHMQDALIAVKGFKALERMTWGRHSIPQPPRLIPKIHLASAWLQSQRVAQAEKQATERLKPELEVALRQSGLVGDADPILAMADVLGEAPPPWGEEDHNELMDLIKKVGPRDPNLSCEAFIKPFFRSLRLQNLHIREMDADVAKFTRLKFLDISQNPLTCIEALPPCLTRLKAYNTQITSITCKQLPTLQFLGLGYTPLAASGLEQAANRFRGLLSLDICFTELMDVAETATPLAALPKLKHLCLAGSPVSLLPHARLQMLKTLPQLQLLDGVAVTEADTLDAQHLRIADEEGAAPGSRLSKIRLELQPLGLTDARTLLGIPAKGLFESQCEMETVAAAAAAKKLTEERGEEIAPLPVDLERDAVAEACKNGVLRLRIQLPDGAWTETAEVALTPELIQACEGDDKPLDKFDLSKLKSKAEEPLFFEVPIAEEGELLRFSRWLRRGLAAQVDFQAAMPPTREELAERAEAAASAALAPVKGKDAKAKAAAKSPEPPKSPEGEEEEAEPPPPQPEMSSIGGAVVPLDAFLWRADSGVTPELREAGELPCVPAPWPVEQEVRVVPMSRWLEPNVQVPLAERKLKKEWGKPGRPECASLKMRVTLYAGEPVEEVVEEEPDPKAKGKKK
eukprot:TRINITY_DN18993_c0_g1_i1.p1 TRINITY_DN18993_c0_g1~~TRINITY_DN18993_c0_g1_i1.p1  ORF type:complete len:749 (+),score=251.15 TRINITY_DN18993_c0_g1_i1:180-2426(+)